MIGFGMLDLKVCIFGFDEFCWMIFFFLLVMKCFSRRSYKEEIVFIVWCYFVVVFIMGLLFVSIVIIVMVDIVNLFEGGVW